MSLDEYLKFEYASPVKHEFVAGEVYAMSGVTTRHNVITLNIFRRLHSAARARGCTVFVTEVKLRAAADRIYYPDAMIACGRAADDQLIVDDPSLIVETTSPSTRATDRREKLDAYLQIPSLRTYMIVEQRRRHVLCYTRDASGEWSRDETLGVGELAIPFLDARLTLDEIYEDVTLPPLTVGENEEWDAAEWADSPGADA
jgi:Uma2 family endonuclease